MKILVIPNKLKDKGGLYTSQIISQLTALGAECFISDNYAYGVGIDASFLHYYKEKRIDVDIILAIGGDGTMIHACRHAILLNKPILGVNLGRVGFLAEMEKDQFDQLDRIIKGDFTVRQRMLLCAQYFRGGIQRQEYTAINDIVICKGNSHKVVDIDTYCNDKFISTYRADGLIFSTPTGTTAYSMSAGGPIVDSELDAMLMTPVCAYSLFARPILFSASQKLRVQRGSQEREESMFMMIDGEEGAKICEDDYVIIKRSDATVGFIELGEKSFFEVLSDKILSRG